MFARALAAPPSVSVPAGDEFCLWLASLDDHVQSGQVNRHVAARLASAMVVKPLEGQSLERCQGGLLSKVLTSVHASNPPCNCLDKVLSWGTCPHVGFFYYRHGRPVVAHTPLILTIRFQHSLQSTATLVRFGCPPWQRLQRTSNGRWRPMEEFEPWARSDAELFQTARRQWRRWSSRGARRLWVVWVSSW